MKEPQQHQDFSKFISNERIYKPHEIIEMLDTAITDDMWIMVKSKRDPHKVLNCPVILDTEASSWLNDGVKQATMYAWALCVNGLCMLGRRWSDYELVMQMIHNHLKLSEEKRIIIYCHNLAYDFQWIRGHHDWINIFAMHQHEPIKALSAEFIEFRCSYLLSGFSLEKVGKDLQKYKMRKMVGDLDYSKIRHSFTPLTKKEVGYIIHDVKVAACYIQERIEADGGINRIPLTSTGYVRNLCRQNCYSKGNYTKYRKLMEELQINDAEEYIELKRSFQGGFTHANEWKSDKNIYDVTSYDFTSSYPAAMVCEKFPMSKGRRVELNDEVDLDYFMEHYCCVFDVQFKNISPKTLIDHPISVSRCWVKENYEEDNGRLVSADLVCTTITDVDYVYLQQFYEWDEMSVANLIVYERGYLPTPLVETILNLYRDKTMLKGVKGREADYLHRKGMANACYGMMVTDIVRDEITFEDDEWGKVPVDIEEVIQEYNQNSKRFLFYPWGVFVTAYARLNLFSGIYEAGNDYCYSDTDSIKIEHAENHMDYINDYNNYNRDKMDAAMESHKLPLDSTRPKTIKGVEKQLGEWDYDGHYKVFRTCGAKRYLTLTDDFEVEMTVAGLGKKTGRDYIVGKYGKYGVFQNFTDGLKVPCEHTGKLGHYYIEEPTKGLCVDYTGKQAMFSEATSIYMEPVKFEMSMSDPYMRRLISLKEMYFYE